MKYDIKPAQVFLQSFDPLQKGHDVYLLRAKVEDLLDPTTYKIVYTEADINRILSRCTYILPGGQQVTYAYDKTRGNHFHQLKGEEMVTYDKDAAEAWFKTYADHQLPPVFRLGPNLNNANFHGSSNMAYYYIHATAAELKQANRFARTPRQFIFIWHDGQVIKTPQYFLTADDCHYQLIKEEVRNQGESYSFAPWHPYKKDVLQEYLLQAT